ncbi:hypothetical protein [Actinoplanes auranticolor]|uniref:Uncharacterized protein n=1 Tax=Actinoplanes auranticolor TaxID=47988 RepID=A0A919SK90_9ACTN|nr:hypothetical protein [Actinoplanes auranticolor]GIM73022.1 hypothetical protein Aau02nite_53890 [Actinoplanes auranticolor]
MAITHMAVLATALLALLCLPCAVAVVVCADELVARRLFSRGGRQETHALRCLEREFSAGNLELRPPDHEPSLEELVAELRRLDRQRRSSPTIDSAAWLTAVLRAYDHRLAMASRSLGLTEHLAQLDGMDREIERVRVEGLLHAAGLRLRAA